MRLRLFAYADEAVSLTQTKKPDEVISPTQRQKTFPSVLEILPHQHMRKALLHFLTANVHCMVSNMIHLK